MMHANFLLHLVATILGLINLMNLKGKLHQSRPVFGSALYNKHEQKCIYIYIIQQRNTQ